MKHAGGAVLIIEDDVDFAKALGDSLKSAGYQIVTSNRPNEAMVKLHRQKFACILVDLQLESYSGLKVIQQVRHPMAKDTLNHDTPILLMSGALNSETIRATAGKVQAVMAKPFDLDAILLKVSEIAVAHSAIKKTIGILTHR